jgi:serine/threonine protein kinase
LAHLDLCSICLEGFVLARGDDVALFAGRYRREHQPLGFGTTGAVYRAFDTHEQRWVALKILHPHWCGMDRMAKNFEAQLRLMRGIRHPHVCAVLDGGRSDDQAFLVMELARHSLAEERPGRTPLALKARLEDFAQVVQGVAALHAAGIVHRDLKPCNVLRMPDGRLAVADFGLAVDLRRESGATPWVGTLGYLAPERAIALRVTPAADVWSLGVMLYALLFDRAPTWPGTRTRLPLQVPAGPPHLRALERLSHECLCYSVEQRLRDATAVASRIDAIRRDFLMPERAASRRTALRRSSRGWRLLSEFALVPLRMARSARRSISMRAVPLLPNLCRMAAILATVTVVRTCAHDSSSRSHHQPADQQEHEKHQTER